MKRFKRKTHLRLSCSVLLCLHCRPTTEGVSAATMAMGDMPAACITKHPMISEGLDLAEMRQRALLVALGLVYYMRLDSKYRIIFAKELDKMFPGIKFLTAFTQEV